jgi:hypothetical protein
MWLRPVVGRGMVAAVGPLGGLMMGWDEPTVYAPYQVRAELARPLPELADRTLDWATDNVMLTPTFVFLRDPAGRSLNIPVDAVHSLHVEVCERPQDYAELRQRYSHAYDTWDASTIESIQWAAMSGETLGNLAERTGRPRDHLASKAHELGCEIDDGPAPQNTTIDDRYRTGNYLVYVGANDRPPPNPAAVLARHNIALHDVYRISAWGFAVHLHRHQADRLEADPDVTSVQPDTDERLAPHHRKAPENRVPGSYIIAVRRTSHPTTVATRAGIVPTSVFLAINSFAADLTDSQLHTLRRDPEVTHIEDNGIVTLD